MSAGDDKQSEVRRATWRLKLTSPALGVDEVHYHGELEHAHRLASALRTVATFETKEPVRCRVSRLPEEPPMEP